MGRKRSSLDDALATARIPYGGIGPTFCSLRHTCRSLGLRGRMLSLFLQLLGRPGARACLPSPPPARPKHECARLASKGGRAAPAAPRLRTGTVTSTRLRYTFLTSNRCPECCCSRKPTRAVLSPSAYASYYRISVCSTQRSIVPSPASAGKAARKQHATSGSLT